MKQVFICFLSEECKQKSLYLVICEKKDSYESVENNDANIIDFIKS